MNKETLTQTAIEAERKADTVFIIILIFTALLLAFCLGYFVAMNEVAAHIKTILN
jgi:uncharacterized protein YpmB